MELHGALHRVCRRRARPPGQAGHRALPARRRHATRRATRSASRSCGKSTRPRPGPAWSCTPPAGRWTDAPMAAASSITWKATRSRSAWSPAWTTSNPWLSPVRGDAALEDAPVDSRAHRRRQAHRLRRTRHHRRRPAQPAQAGLPGRRAGRLRCRNAQCRAHQGQPRGDEVRHAVRRGPVRSRRQAGPPPRRTQGLPGSLSCQLAVGRVERRAQLQAVVQVGQPRRRPDDRHRTLAAAQARHQERARGRCTATSPTTCA